jgi:guanosine-3',5'-bis(diphosphate) 3'-pyrophosphohydrolase
MRGGILTAPMIRQFELVERVKAYDPGADEELLNRAYVYGLMRHGKQMRASGDPYFSHPLEVAGILTQLRLDSASIVTALLHDTIEDTDATLEEIESLFGQEIGRLVDGVTKLSKLELQSEHTKQAENFRKLVLAMSDDIRVLVVKLADRLHNMRTLEHLKSEDKRRRIARETMDIYAPLASRLGLENLKDELQDLAFSVLNPEGDRTVRTRLESLRAQGGDLVPKVTAALVATLKDGGVEAQVSGREKRPYSVWDKMLRKNVAFEQLSDIVAFRVVVNTVEECYRALGLLHGRYRAVPERFKDYISLPKPNGYRSLHTAVQWEGGRRIEIQVRTREMHDAAELGSAAHWLYKNRGEPVKGSEGTQYAWLRGLLDILDKASGPEEFLEHTKLEMYQDQVFCFTPKGDLIHLPRGATPVDFAYAVHSRVGDACIGAKVNGRMTPLRTQLKNGDQVDIVTSKTQAPSAEWERFVVTGKAKAAIRRFLRTRQREQYASLGRSMIEREFKGAGEEPSEKGLEGVLANFKQDSVEDLAAQVGAGLVSARDVLVAVYPGLKPRPPARTYDAPTSRSRSKDKARDRDAGGLPIRGLIPGLAVHYARCCHPLPGDRIVGIITTGKGVNIHTIDCGMLESFAEQPERWIDLSWETADDGAEARHTGRLKLTVANERGSLASLSNVIAKNNGNIANLKIVRRAADFFDMVIDVEVADARHLADISAALRATPAVNAVERARG